MAELRFIGGYPEYMRGSIGVVEKTRQQRIGKLPPQMNLSERKEVLKLCHPDYVEGGKRALNIGVNKGDIAPNEVADLLEAYPLIRPGEIDLKQVDYEPEILIIGGGLAGTSAAPLVIKWLCDLGAMFDRDEEGNFIELTGGGTSRRRMHACKDYTGLEELRVLKDEFINHKIRSLEYYPAVELLTDPKGSVTGAVVWGLETGDYKIVKAKATILATGGFGRLHIRGFPTTNHYGATCDGVVLAYRAGAKLRDTDTVQYHPTGAAYPQQIIGLLITEKLRTQGAQPVNEAGEAFVFPLEPRDVEASAIIKECYLNNGGVRTPAGMLGVWLDTPLIDILHGKGTTDRFFPGMVRMFKRFDIDLVKDPVLIFPTLHYQNGGVECDPQAGTSLEGLFVAGEISGGVHGKNRLMGNSTLDCLVFGRRAGIAAAEYVTKRSNGREVTLNHLDKYIAMLKKAGIGEERKTPLLLPEYRGKAVLARMIDIF